MAKLKHEAQHYARIDCIVRAWQVKHVRMWGTDVPRWLQEALRREGSGLTYSKGDGWTLSGVEVKFGDWLIQDEDGVGGVYLATAEDFLQEHVPVTLD